MSVHGSPAEVAEKVASDPAVKPADDFITHFSYGQDFDATQTNRHLELLVSVVGPQRGRTPSA